MNKLNTILRIIKKYDTKTKNTYEPYIEDAVKKTILTNKPLILTTFTCSTINTKYMFDEKDPELYVSLSPKGNNLESDLDKLEEMFLALSKYIIVRLIILIGNTDPFYIYTQETQALPNLTEKDFWFRFGKRWNLYKQNLESYLLKRNPNLNVEVISWYELEKYWEKNQGWDFRRQFTKTRKNILKYFSKEDLEWELRKLKKSFGQSLYFSNTKKPATSVLKDWVKRKFAEYATQGLWIKQIYPDVILLQNEKPSDLRTRMYQPLIQEKLNTKLPVIYPFGVDNVGFQ